MWVRAIVFKQRGTFFIAVFNCSLNWIFFFFPLGTFVAMLQVNPQGAAVANQATVGRWWGHPKQITFYTNLESAINLSGMFLDCGGKLVSLEKIHVCTRRSCKLHTDRPQQGFILGPFCCEGVLTTSNTVCPKG